MDIVYCQDYEELDEEKAKRSVVVSNIPPEFGAGEKLLIHFQKEKNGGGEIERLCMVEPDGTAVITYEEAHGKLILKKGGFYMISEPNDS